MKSPDKYRKKDKFFSHLEFPPPKRILSFLLILLLIIVYVQKIQRTYTFHRFSPMSGLFSGDEPKYLRMLNSLSNDGDLDLSNQILKKEEREIFKKEVLASGTSRFGDLYIVGKNWGIYSLHMPGLPFFLFPAFKLDSFFYPDAPQRFWGALSPLPSDLTFTRLWLVVIALLTLVLMFRLLLSFFSSPFLVTGLLLLFILNSPFSEYSLQFYPSVSATFLSLLALNALFRPFPEKWLNCLFIIVGIGFLPWLDQGFVPLSIGLFLVFLFHRDAKKFPWKRVIVVSLFLCLLSLPYFYYFYSITGNPSPLSPFQLFGQIHGRFSTIPLGFFGHFFSRDFGLVWAYPYILFFFFGIDWGWKERRKQSLDLLTVFLPYYLICSAAVAWTGDTLPPGRFLVPLFPIFLIFIGFTFQDLYRHFSFAKLVFYTVYLAMVFLNKKIWLVNLNFSPGYLTPSDWPRIMVSLFILFLLYFSLILGRFFLFSKKKEAGTENRKN